MKQQLRACFVGAIVALLVATLGGCSPGARAPIAEKAARPEAAPSVASRGQPARPRPAAVRPDVHVVARGDTLHAIAWRYRLDFRDLVAWNAIRDPNVIYVGQKLRLRPPPARVARAPASSSGAASKPPGGKRPSAPAKPPRKPSPAKPLSWVWPARGRVTPAVTVSGAKGIEIRGRKGQEVKAAAPGTVVYSGSGLRGYGELIIVKHDETFLSAYAHNESRLVPEGRKVEAGETIARMGDTEAKDVMLHFEIRRNGDAVDPLKYLPGLH